MVWSVTDAEVQHLAHVTLRLVDLETDLDVMNCAQPLHTDIPHFCAWTFPTCTDLFETVIECTATDHMIFS